ncbi:MAG TPA: CDP-alcohol phosphatidyltransferase family protein [Thermoplasmatales archaeon]|nr:CDP-alcohol phosphatidyltransferase family protein [Thermoplasmatales archaeon]
MVLDSQRERIDPILTPIAKAFLSLSPNAITWLSLIFALLAGIFFFFSNPNTERFDYFLCIASLFVFLNGMFDAIDGKVAKLTRRESLVGDFLDHAIDRYSDVLMVAGLSLSPWCRSEIGVLAIAGVLLTSYMGTQAQAVGYGRMYRGLLGRADRLTLLIIFPVLQHFLVNTNPFDFTLLEWVLIYFAIVGNITAIQRFYLTMKWFKNREGD